jgi:nucleoside-diphosphate-sugar epimerase
LIWRIATSSPEDKLPELDFPYWVDVRDVANAHMEALLRPGADGNRFILAPIKTTYADMARILRTKLGFETSLEEQRVEIFDVRDEGCNEVLGMKEWKGLEKMVLDTVGQVRRAEEDLKGSSG